MKISRSLIPVFAAALTMGGPAAQAQSADDYPSRAVTWVVPFGAGGGPDSVARLLAPSVSARLGQPVLVVNRPGAGGTPGVASVATARPDGYTFVHGSNGTHGIAPVLYPSLSYDPNRDFIGVTRLTSVSFLLMVLPTSKVTTLQQFIDDLKAHPDMRTFGTSGVGSIPHFAGEALQGATGTKARHIPYKTGPAAALTDVLGGRLDFFIDSTTNSYALVKSGRMRGLAVLTAAPKAFPPEIPTLASVGIKDFNIFAWDAAFVPAGTPKAVVEKLNRAITEAMNEPQMQKTFLERGATLVPTSVQETAEFLRTDLPRWAEATRRLGVKAE